MTEKHKEISNILKLKILFTDYFIIIFLIFILNDLMKSILGIERGYPWLFRLLIYSIYFFLSELYFNKTLGMNLFGVSIVNKKKGKITKGFVIYSFIALLDRFILMIIYIFRVLFQSEKKLLICEKFSGLRWVRISYYR